MKEYIKISIERKTADRFKVFTKKNQGTYSEILNKMIDFFEYNDMELDKVEFDAVTLGKLINKRFNAIYGMLKIIEREQTKPTHGMMAEIFAKLDLKNDHGEALIDLEKKPKFVQKKPSE